MIKAIVGAGGKTSLIKQYVEKYRAQGLKVFVTTSTHMFIEEDTLLTDDADDILLELEQKKYVMAGIPVGKKMSALSKATYEKVCEYADVVLVEADGSKHMPIKFPNENEPVIYDNVDEIVVVCGLHALGRKVKDVAHRLELVKKCLNIEDEEIIRANHIQKLVREGYITPLKQKYPDKVIKISPSHDGSEEQKRIAWMIQEDADVLDEGFVACQEEI